MCGIVEVYFGLEQGRKFWFIFVGVVLLFGFWGGRSRVCFCVFCVLSFGEV